MKESSQILNELNEWNCDVKGAMERFLQDEEFYTTCLVTATNESGFESLGEALKNNSISDAFEAAHMLKGVFGNMGITPMYELLSKMVDKLRKEQSDGLDIEYEQLIEDNIKLKSIIE